MTPFIKQILHPMTPFFTTVHTQWPLFLNLNVKFQMAPASHAIQKCSQFSAEKGEFSLKLDKIYTEWPPILGSLHQKRPNLFLKTHTQWPLFPTKSYTEWPWFRSAVGTYPSFASAPGPPGRHSITSGYMAAMGCMTSGSLRCSE